MTLNLKLTNTVQALFFTTQLNTFINYIFIMRSFNLIYLSDLLYISRSVLHIDQEETYHKKAFDFI